MGCASDRFIVTRKFISGLPDHYIEDLSFNNIMLETNAGAVKSDIENVTVPELDLEYLNGWWAGIYTSDRDNIVLPAHGFFARHINGLYLNDIFMSTRHKDERPAIVLDDVNNFYQISLFDEGKSLKKKDVINY